MQIQTPYIWQEGCLAAQPPPGVNAYVSPNTKTCLYIYVLAYRVHYLPQCMQAYMHMRTYPLLHSPDTYVVSLIHAFLDEYVYLPLHIYIRIDIIHTPVACMSPRVHFAECIRHMSCCMHEFVSTSHEQMCTSHHTVVCVHKPTSPSSAHTIQYCTTSIRSSTVRQWHKSETFLPCVFRFQTILHHSMHVYIHTCVGVCTCVCVYIYIYIYMCVCVCVCTLTQMKSSL
jgi:hypothetical protein